MAGIFKLIVPVAICLVLWSQPSIALTLNGNVEDDVASKFPIGSSWDEGRLPAIGTADVWYRLPPWMAGKWHCSRSKTGNTLFNEVYDATYGDQMDAQGEIWECKIVPYVKRIGYGGGLQRVYFVSNCEPIGVDYGGTQTIKITTHENVIENLNGRVTKSYRQSDWYIPTPGNTNTLYLRSFRVAQPDPNKPQIQQDTYSTLTRTAAFTRRDFSDTGKDLRQSFKAFLMANNMANLVPQDLR